MAPTPKPDAGLYKVRPDSLEDPAWFGAGQSTVANTSYTSLDCRSFGTVWLEFIMGGADSDAGDLFIEYSFDDVTFYAFALDAGKFAIIDPGSKLTPVESEGKITVAALAAETRFSMGVEKPPPFMRGRWVSASGGSATGMTGKNFGRG